MGAPKIQPNFGGMKKYFFCFFFSNIGIFSFVLHKVVAVAHLALKGISKK